MTTNISLRAFDGHGQRQYHYKENKANARVSDCWNWAYFRANLRKYWKYDPCLYQFLHWIRGHHYTRRLILRPMHFSGTSSDRPLYSEPPPRPRGNDHDERNTFYLSKIKTLIFFQHVQLGLISLIFLCSDIAYVLKQKQRRKRNKKKETTTLGGPSCWIIKHEITNWFFGRLFLFFPFLFLFFFYPFFSLFLFLSPFLSFFSRKLGRAAPATPLAAPLD